MKHSPYWRFYKDRFKLWTYQNTDSVKNCSLFLNI